VIILKNAISFIAIWGSQIIILIANLLTQAILTRSFFPADYGKFVSALSIVSIFATLASFGISQYWLKIFGREGLTAYRWMKYSRYLLLVSTILAIIGCLLFVSFTGNQEVFKYTLYLVPIIIYTAIYSLLTSIFQLSRQYIKMSIFQTFMPVLKLVTAFFIAYIFVEELKLIAMGYSVISLILILMSLKYYIKFINKKIPLLEYEKIEYKITKKSLNFRLFLKEVSPYGFLGFFYLIYYQIDVFMINTFNLSENAAYYSVAISILSAIYVFPTAIYQRFFGPQIHKWVYHDVKKVMAFHKIGNDVMILLSAFIIFGIGIFGEMIIVWIFGENYKFSYEILILLTFSIPFRLLGNNMGTIFNTGNYVNSKLIIQGTAAVFNVMLNFVLLKTIGLYGAITATIFTELYVWWSFKIVYSKKQKLSLRLSRRSIVPILFLLLTYLIFLVPEGWNLMLFITGWIFIFIILVRKFIKRYYLTQHE